MAEGALKPAVLYWDNSTAQFHNTAGGREYYTNGPPDNRFGELLERAFDQRGIAYNVYLRFLNTQGRTVTTRYVYSGEPSDNAVRAARLSLTVDITAGAAGTRDGTRLGDPSSGYQSVLRHRKELYPLRDQCGGGRVAHLNATNADRYPDRRERWR